MRLMREISAFRRPMQIEVQIACSGPTVLRVYANVDCNMNDQSPPEEGREELARRRQQARIAIKNGYLPKNPDAKWESSAGGVSEYSQSKDESAKCYVCGWEIKVDHCDGTTKWYWLSDVSGLITFPKSHPKLHLDCHKIWHDVACEILEGRLPY